MSRNCVNWRVMGAMYLVILGLTIWVIGYLTFIPDYLISSSSSSSDTNVGGGGGGWWPPSADAAQHRAESSFHIDEGGEEMEMSGVLQKMKQESIEEEIVIEPAAKSGAGDGGSGGGGDADGGEAGRGDGEGGEEGEEGESGQECQNKMCESHINTPLQQPEPPRLAPPPPPLIVAWQKGNNVKTTSQSFFFYSRQKTEESVVRINVWKKIKKENKTEDEVEKKDFTWRHLYALGFVTISLFWIASKIEEAGLCGRFGRRQYEFVLGTPNNTIEEHTRTAWPLSRFDIYTDLEKVRAVWGAHCLDRLNGPGPGHCGNRSCRQRACAIVSAGHWTPLRNHLSVIAVPWCGRTDPCRLAIKTFFPRETELVDFRPITSTPTINSTSISPTPTPTPAPPPVAITSSSSSSSSSATATATATATTTTTILREATTTLAAILTPHPHPPLLHPSSSLLPLSPAPVFPPPPPPPPVL